MELFTPRERTLIDTIASWRGPDLPTAASLWAVTGYTDESGVRKALTRLAERGLVELKGIGSGKRRTMVIPHLTEKALEFTKPAESPVEVELRGRAREVQAFPIACGPFMDADAEAATSLFDVRDLFSSWDDSRDYLLIGKGESMVDPTRPEISIFDGDFVQVRAQLPREGDIVHAEYVHRDGERECTLKVYHLQVGMRFGAHNFDTVHLSPLNPAYRSMQISSNACDVRGVAIEWLSKRARWGQRK